MNEPQPDMEDPGMLAEGPACWVDWLALGIVLAAFVLLIIAAVTHA